MSKAGKIVLVVLLVLVLACGGVVIYLMNSMQSKAVNTVEAPDGFFEDNTDLEQLAEESAEPTVEPGPADIVTVQAAQSTPMPIYETDTKSDDITNILLVGADSRDAGSTEGRSDTMMVLSYNRSKNIMYVISFMRDAQVKRIGENSTFKGKLNAAYNGGIGELINTLNLNFDLGLQKYASVGFSGFWVLIDGIGGVELHTTPDEAYRVNWRVAGLLKADDKRDYMEILKQGDKDILNDEEECTQTLWGEQMLWYCRDRYSDFTQEDGTVIKGGDAARIARQQYVIRQALKKVTTQLDWKSLLSIYNYASNWIETNMDLATIVDLGASIFNSQPEFVFLRIPETYTQAKDEEGNETTSLVFDLKKAKTALHEEIYGADTTPTPKPDK